MTMQDNEASVAASLRRGPWNKGKLVGAKPPLRPKHVWSIRTKLHVADRKRDLAMFNLAIRKVCRAFVLLCRRLGLFDEASVAIDGSKFKAVNNRDKNFTEAKMTR